MSARGDHVVRVLPVTEVRGYEEWLTPAERGRRDRLVRAADRTAYVAAHLLVRTVAADLLGIAASEVAFAQECPDCGGADHGRPSIVEPAEAGRIHVSLSHADGVVAAMAADRPCGIDVERVGREIPPRALTATERAWADGQDDAGRARILLWTRKEALAKATGIPLAHALATDTHTDPRRFGTWRGLGHLASWTS